MMKLDFRFLAVSCIFVACCFAFSSCMAPQPTTPAENTTQSIPATEVLDYSTTETTLEEATREEITTPGTTTEETAATSPEPDFTNTPDPDGTKRY